jgi:hypothetical protein
MFHRHSQYILLDQQELSVTQNVGNCKIYPFRNLEKSRGCTRAAEAKRGNIGSLKQPLSQNLTFPLDLSVKDVKFNIPTKLRPKKSTELITFRNRGLSIVADSAKEYGARKESLTDNEWLSVYEVCDSIHY